MVLMRGLVAFAGGFMSGIVHGRARRPTADAALVIRIWADEPHKSAVISEIIVSKNGNGWSDHAGFTVEPIGKSK